MHNGPGKQTILVDFSYFRPDEGGGPRLTDHVVLRPRRKTKRATRYSGSSATNHASPERSGILVADDSRINRGLIESVLAKEDHTVLIADNGREALDSMAKHQPSVLITDWKMPGPAELIVG